MTANLPTPRIIRTRRKTVALIIDYNGSLVVRAPLHLSKQRIEKIIREKADWIRTRQGQVLSRQASSMPHEYLAGEEFWYLGERYTLQFVDNNRTPLVLSTHFLLDERFRLQAARVFEAWYRCQARLVLTERATQIASQLGLKYNHLRMSSAHTRWGSCSSRGTISLAWRLVMAPMPVIDYVVLHELIHLRIHNHSKEFWAQVAAMMPGYRTQVDWLKQHGHQLRL